MPDFSLPRWLEPPSETEKARINQAAVAAGEKAAVMLRRSIGVRRLQAEAKEAIQNGVDPTTAKQNALFNNADLLFSDNPEMVSRLLDSDVNRQLKEQARLQSMQAKETANLFNALRIDQAQQRLDQQATQAQERLDAKKRELDITQERNQTASKLRESEEEGRNLRSELSQKRLRQQSETNAKIKVEQMLQTDPNHVDLVNKVVAARTAAAKAHKSTGKTLGIFGYSKEDVAAADQALRKAEKELRDYRAKVGDRFNVDMTEDDTEPTPPATPAPAAQPTTVPKRLKWTPQGLVPVQ